MSEEQLLPYTHDFTHPTAEEHKKFHEWLVSSGTLDMLRADAREKDKEFKKERELCIKK